MMAILPSQNGAGQAKPTVRRHYVSSSGVKTCRPAEFWDHTTWKPWTFFAVAVAGWMNRQQKDAIEILKEENNILSEKLGPKRLTELTSPSNPARMNTGKESLSYNSFSCQELLGG